MQIPTTALGICQMIEDQTGLKCYYEQRADTSLDHFEVSIINTTDFYADNKLTSQYFNLQISFNTKNAFNKMKYNKLIKKLFNVGFTTSYEFDSEWYRVIYEPTVFLNE